MTNPMLAELDAVVRLRDAAEYENVYGSCESFAEADKAYKAGAASFIATHAPALADMAKRIEAAERDAARYAFLRDDPPVELSVRKREENRRDGNAYLYIDGPELDRQIDAAIDATQEGAG